MEHVHQIILEECYRPTIARPGAPFTTLRTDPARDLRYYNHDPANTGRRAPAQVLGAVKMCPQRPPR